MNEMRNLMETVKRLDEEFVEYRDPDGQFMVIHVGRKGYRVYGSGAYKDKISPEMFDDLDDAIEHAEICMGIEDDGTY